VIPPGWSPCFRLLVLFSALQCLCGDVKGIQTVISLQQVSSKVLLEQVQESQRGEST